MINKKHLYYALSGLSNCDVHICLEKEIPYQHKYDESHLKMMMGLHLKKIFPMDSPLFLYIDILYLFRAKYSIKTSTKILEENGK